MLPQEFVASFSPRETSVPGVQICEHMPRLAAAMHLATLVRSVSHTIAEHTQGTAYVMTGNRPDSGSRLSIARLALGSLAGRARAACRPT